MTDSLPLIQIASYRIGGSNSTIMDVSDGANSHHRYSVIIHDHTDAESLASSMHALSRSESGQAGVTMEDLPVPHSQGEVPRKKAASTAATSSVSTTGGLKKTTEGGKNDKKQKDGNATKPAKRGFFGRKAALTNKSPKTPAVVKHQGRVGNQPNGGKTTRQNLTQGVTHVDDQGDALDHVFNSVERMTCLPGEMAEQPSKTNDPGVKWGKPIDPPKPVEVVVVDDDWDALDHVFEGVEHLTCRPGTDYDERATNRSSPRQIASSPPSASKNTKRKSTVYAVVQSDVSSYDNKLYHTSDGTEQASNRNDSSTPRGSHNRDLLDAMCEGVEGLTCRKPSMLGKMDAANYTEAMNTPKRQQQQQHRSSRASTKNQSLRSHTKGETSDMLDTLCSGVEYVMCRPDETAVLRDAKSGYKSKPDILDAMCEPMDVSGVCPNTHESYDLSPYHIDHHANSVVETVQTDDLESRSSNVTEFSNAVSLLGNQRQKASPGSPGHDRDLLDSIFEGTEARLCKPEDEDVLKEASSSSPQKSGQRIFNEARARRKVYA